jgi:hypothetical protein
VTRAPFVQLLRDGCRAAIEPFIGFLQACAETLRSETSKTPDAQLRAQNLAELRDVIEAWPKLSPELRVAMLAVTQVPKVRHKSP